MLSSTCSPNSPLVLSSVLKESWRRHVLLKILALFALVQKMLFVYDSVATPRHSIKYFKIQTANSLIKAQINKRTLSLLATADIGSGFVAAAFSTDKT